MCTRPSVNLQVHSASHADGADLPDQLVEVLRLEGHELDCALALDAREHALGTGRFHMSGGLLVRQAPVL